MTTDFEKNKADQHLQNLTRQVREALQSGTPVQAYINLGVLDNYLNGKDMFGQPWRAE